MPDKVLAFYIRLSSEDRDLKTNALKNESNSVFTKGGYSRITMIHMNRSMVIK